MPCSTCVIEVTSCTVCFVVLPVVLCCAVSCLPACVCVVCNASDSRTEVKHDAVIGTAIYMSPEIMRGSDDDDPASSGYGRSTVSAVQCSAVQ
jgi:hypothetical protein